MGIPRFHPAWVAGLPATPLSANGLPVLLQADDWLPR